MIEVFRNTKKRNEKDVVRRPFFVGLDVKDVNDYKFALVCGRKFVCYMTRKSLIFSCVLQTYRAATY